MTETGQDWTFGGTWPYEPRWLETDGVRIHYVDEGPRGGEPVVMLHGNPTWSYVYRNFVRSLRDAGYRAIAHDELGFGRSEKPESESEYTIQRHARHFAALMDELGLDGVTLVLQDWGGPIGLSWAVENPGRVRRLVLLNTWTGSDNLPDHPKPPALFRLLRGPTGSAMVKRMHMFVKVFLFRGGTRDLDENAKAAYLAPHPTAASRAGVLAYPRLIPWDDDSPTKPLGRRNEQGLSKLEGKPVLICWPTKDRGFKEKTLEFWRGRFPDADVHELEAGHYIQEDAHEEVVPLLLGFLERTKPAKAAAPKAAAPKAAAPKAAAPKLAPAAEPKEEPKAASKPAPAAEPKEKPKAAASKSAPAAAPKQDKPRRAASKPAAAKEEKPKPAAAKSEAPPAPPKEEKPKAAASKRSAAGDKKQEEKPKEKPKRTAKAAPKEAEKPKPRGGRTRSPKKEGGT